MNLGNKLMQVLFKPRKVHGLPGRLRVHLPFLKKVDPARNDLADMVSALCRVPDEVERAEVTLATGNVLILYDDQRITEEEVLQYVRGLVEIFLKNRERLQDLDPAKTPALQALILSALGHRLALDTDLEISDDVLA